MTATRRKLDQYFTPASATRELLKYINITNCYILECCSGQGDIANILKAEGGHGGVGIGGMKTNDIDPNLNANYNRDVSIADRWGEFPRGAHWVISNPPFNQAAQIIPLAFNYAEVGIAMLLRLSYLEPVENRGAWLNKHPPTQLIVLPRISFTGNGKTDNVTCAWMVWEKGKQGTVTVAENPKFT